MVPYFMEAWAVALALAGSLVALRRLTTGRIGVFAGGLAVMAGVLLPAMASLAP